MSGYASGMVVTLQGEMGCRNEHSVSIADVQRSCFLKGLFDGCDGEEYAAEVLLCTDRLWCSKLRLLKRICPTARVIAYMRYMHGIIASIEQLVHKNAVQRSSIFRCQPGGTVYSRAAGLANGEAMVGFVDSALKEACYSETTANRVLLQYETLVKDPVYAMKAIYAVIGEPAFEHATTTSRLTRRTSMPALASLACTLCAKKWRRVSASACYRRMLFIASKTTLSGAIQC